MKAHGLHAQLWTQCADYAELLPQLVPLGIPIVLDHMGSFNAAAGINDTAFQTLLRFLSTENIWIKLSVCRTSKQFPDYPDTRPFHDALVNANPNQLVWGSDWPFVRMGELSPNAGHLVDLFHDWVSDTTLRQKILVDNPAKLYGFKGFP